MRVMVTFEHRFISTPDGHIYTRGTVDYSFLSRYLAVFDEVVVLARVENADEIPPNKKRADGPNVSFFPLPYYLGPIQFLKRYRKVKSNIKQAVNVADAYILRVAGSVGTLLWHHLMKKGIPYGVEVVGDPWDVLSPGNVTSIVRPYARWSWTRNLRTQCNQATAVAYVTEHALQKRYPPNEDAYTCNYSSIDLKVSDICKDISDRIDRISCLQARLRGNGPPVVLGFVGSFSQAHKLPHVHLAAIAECIARNANVCLEMIGGGQLLEDMKALARKLGIASRVRFRGLLPAGKSIMEAFDSFDLFLNATASEGLPRVVIEAMSRGCPCIASDVGGTSELLEMDYLVAPHDANSLAEKILEVLARPRAMSDAVKRNVTVAANYCRDVLQPRRQAFYRAVRERTEKYLTEHV